MKRTRLKRIQAFILCVIMIFGVISPGISVWAEAHPYVRTATEMETARSESEILEAAEEESVFSDGKLSAEGMGYAVTLEYDEKAKISDDVFLSVEEIKEDTEDYDNYLKNAAAALSREEDIVAEELPYARFFDISIVGKNGEKIEPVAPVSVSIDLRDDVLTTEDVTFAAIHFSDDENAEPELIAIAPEDAGTPKADSKVEFEAESFSTYGVFYYYTEDAQNIETDKAYNSGKKSNTTSDVITVKTAGDSNPPVGTTGDPFTYWVTETAIEGYKTTYSGATHGVGTPDGIMTGGTITNTRTPVTVDTEDIDGAGAPLIAKKVDQLPPDSTSETFTFSLAAEGNAPTPPNVIGTATVTNATDAFPVKGLGSITFTEPGTYTYKLVEQTEAGWTATPASPQTITITVVNGTGANAGKLVVDPALSTLTITNTYTPTKGQLSDPSSLELTKVLSGRTTPLKNGEFWFQMDGQQEGTYGSTKGIGGIYYGTHRANGDIKFPAIAFSEPGIYTYLIKEMNGYERGISYDETPRYAKVTVTDTDSDGTFEFAWELVSDPGRLGDDTFENSYNDGAVTVTVGVTDDADIPLYKTLYGRDMAAGEFKIHVVGPNLDTVVDVPASGAGASVRVPMPKVTFTRKDMDNKDTKTFEYKVHELAGNLSGVTYDTREYTYVATVVDPGPTRDLQVVSWALSNGAPWAEFENSYSSDNVSTGDGLNSPNALKVTKKVEGGDAVAPFTFKLEPADDATTEAVNSSYVDMPNKDTTTVAKLKKGEQQTAVFDGVRFEKAGTYTFKITETSVAPNRHWAYDNDPRILTVVVVDTDAQGVKADKLRIASITGNNPTITNTYTPTPTVLDTNDIDGQGTAIFTKTVKADPGFPDSATEQTFKFALAAKDGAPGPSKPKASVTVTKDAATGDISTEDIDFGTISFTVDDMRDANGDIQASKTFTYVMLEQKEAGWKANTATTTGIEYTITVKYDATTDTLTVDDDKLTPAATVVNEYDPTEQIFVPTGTGDGQIKVGKKITAAQGSTAPAVKRGMFEFKFESTDRPSLGTWTVNNDAAGKVEFPAIGFTKPGVYTFELTETDEELPGFAYDASTYTVRATVTDGSATEQADGTYEVVWAITAKDGQRYATPIDEVKFDNVYTDSEITVTPIPATKQLTVPAGSTRLLAADEFTFYMVGGEDTKVEGKNVAATAVNTPASVSWDDLKFSVSDLIDDEGNFATSRTFKFAVYEEPGTDDNIVYDGTHHERTLTLEWDPTLNQSRGGLKATWDNDAMIAFVNEYVPDGVASSPTDAGNLTITKRVVDSDGKGRTPQTNEFLFEMSFDSSNPSGLAPHNTSALGTNEAAGSGGAAPVSFPNFFFTKAGTYTFKVKELAGNDDDFKGGGSYDSAVYTVVATVTDNDTGKLEVAWKFNDDTMAKEFVNTTKTTMREILVRAVWYGDDYDAPLGTTIERRPAEVEVKLQYNAGTSAQPDWRDVSSVAPVKLRPGTVNYEWSASFGDVHAYNQATGERIAYRVVETAPVEGYTTTYIQPGASTLIDGAVVIHKYNVATLTGTKNWVDGGRTHDNAAEVALTVKRAVGGGTPEILTAGTDYHLDWDGNDFAIRGLAEADKDGNTYTFSIEEAQVAGYDAPVVTGNMNEGFVVTNTIAQQYITIPVTRVLVNGSGGDSVTVELLADGKKVAEHTFNDAGRYNFNQDAQHNYLPKYALGGTGAAGDGHEIDYTVNIDSSSAYTILGDAVKGFVVTDTVEEITIPVTKIWDDANNQDGVRPEKVLVGLKVGDDDAVRLDGNPVAAIELNADNGWTGVFKVVKRTDYRVVEYDTDGQTERKTGDTVFDDKYKISITGNAEAGFKIKNSHTPEKREIRAIKEWDDVKVGDEFRTDVTFRLYGTNDGKVVYVAPDVKTIKKGATGEDAIARWSDLPVHHYSRTPMEWVIVEDAVSGYTSSVMYGYDDGTSELKWADSVAGIPDMRFWSGDMKVVNTYVAPTKHKVTYVDPLKEGGDMILKELEFDTQSQADNEASGKAGKPGNPSHSGWVFSGWEVVRRADGDYIMVAKYLQIIPEIPSKPEAKVSGTLLAKATAKNKSQTISWSKIQGAAGYDIFFAQCNHSGKQIVCEKVRTIKGNKTFSWTKSGLKKGTSYKAYVKAYVMKNGKKSYVKTSPMVHAYTGNASGKYTNAKKVTVNKTEVTLKKDKTFQIKASVKKVKKSKRLMPKRHVTTIRYMSSNKKVATVSTRGRITARGRGSCYIYVYAHNGVSKKIKVTVK